MNPDDINKFLNTPDDSHEDIESLQDCIKNLVDDMGNEFVGIRIISTLSSSTDDFIKRLKSAGFTGVPKFQDKYAHLESRAPKGFIEDYNNIAETLNNLFHSGELTALKVQELEAEFTRMRKEFKTE